MGAAPPPQALASSHKIRYVLRVTPLLIGKDGIDGRIKYKNGQPPADRRRTVPRGSPVARQARARGDLGGRRARGLAPVPGSVRTPGGRRTPPIGAAPDRLARLLLRPPARARWSATAASRAI